MAQDPIKDTATRIVGSPHEVLERRLKLDMFYAITNVKPALAENVAIENDVMTGEFFVNLPAALQGIAVVKLENSISFYDRIGWKDAYLEMPIEHALTQFQATKINERLSLNNMHELAYISHKHIEKIERDTVCYKSTHKLTILTGIPTS
ncbi:MAG: hypothetical protein AAF404_06585 [Pseudomonadota bacterium]